MLNTFLWFWQSWVYLEVIDSHVHYGGWGYGKGLPKLQVGEMLREFDKNGVDKAVVFSGHSTDFHAANDELQNAVQEAKGRFIPFARVNPYDGEKALEELRLRIKSQGWSDNVLRTLGSLDSQYMAIKRK